MMRTFLLIAAFGITSIAHAEVMTCDETKPCSLVCYFPSSSGRTAPVYPDGGGSVDRVIVTTVGDSNLLYIAERRNESTTMPSYRPLETFILPKDYPCRLSPAELLSELAGSEVAEPATGRDDEGSN